jgi:anion transporter
MTIMAQGTDRGSGQGKPGWFRANWGLLLAVAALFAALMLPTPEGLSIAGHRMLAILLFAVIVWMTEAIDYAVSAIVIAGLMAFLLGFSPNPAKPDSFMGTNAGLALAMSGFSSGAVALVGAALFLAAAVTTTGLDRRIALGILSRVGTQTRHMVVGTILVGIVLAFVVPSTTARVACLIPIILGIAAAFGAGRHSAFTAMLMITTVQTSSFWNMGIKTAAAQNMVALGFIEKATGETINWLEWLMAGAPLSILMSIALYFVMMRMMPPEIKQAPGGREAIAKALAEMGPMQPSEKKLLAITLILLAFWASEDIFHDLDTSTVTVAGIALMFLPGIGIMTWKDAQPKIPWGTLLLLGVGISVGSALSQTKAAAWLAEVIVAEAGIEQATPLFILAAMSLFLIVIHLGFANASGLASAMIPIIIALLQGVKTPGINVVGMTLIFQFVVSFGLILVVNGPQNLVAYGSDTFSARDFARTGIVLTVIGFALVLLLGATYWHWLGYV